MTVEKLVEFINFLLNESQRYKDDLLLEYEEFYQFKIELENLKMAVNDSHQISSKIKTRVSNLSLDAEGKKSNIKKIIRYAFLGKIGAHQENQTDKNQALKRVEQDLRNVLVAISLNK